MGLDSYFGVTDTEGKLQPVDGLNWPINDMVGGLFSGVGDGSFRGKSYNHLFEVMTGGDSLYHEHQPTEWVEEKAAQMEAYLASENPYFHNNGWPEWDEKDQATKLAQTFRFAADNNLEYVGWW